jgi:hypothetical protein
MCERERNVEKVENKYWKQKKKWIQFVTIKTSHIKIQILVNKFVNYEK